jgi:pathogen-inducible salicylic acid glucosyltransferase
VASIFLKIRTTYFLSFRKEYQIAMAYTIFLYINDCLLPASHEENSSIEMEGKAHGAHVLVLPYPTQGHINPMLQFSKRLASKGVKVTLATTVFIFNSMQPRSSESVQFDTISDGHDEGGFAQAESIHTYLARLEAIGSKTLADIVIKHKDTAHPIDCIIYDHFLPWALDVAKKLGLLGAAFFTQPCAVNFIYYHVHHGLLKLPISSTPISIPGLPLLELQDMPSFIYVSGSYPAYFEMVLSQFSNSDKADWALVNTFYELEVEVGCAIYILIH